MLRFTYNIDSVANGAIRRNLSDLRRAFMYVISSTSGNPVATVAKLLLFLDYLKIIYTVELRRGDNDRIIREKDFCLVNCDGATTC